MEDTLIICVGNRARGDDGVAWEVARQLGDSGTGHADLVTAVSLDVTHAEDVAASRRLVVVDAIRRDEPAVEVFPIQGESSVRDTHGMTPESLVTLAHRLYGSRPESAWIVACAAPDMGHEEGLSPTARAAASEAATVVMELLRS